jgi:hypothetical protein
LIRKNTCCRYGVFKVRASSIARPAEPELFRHESISTMCRPARSLKAQQRTLLDRASPSRAIHRGRRCSRRDRAPDEPKPSKELERIDGSDASGVIAPDSLERR